MKKIKYLLLIIIILIISNIYLTSNDEIKNDYYNYVNEKTIEKQTLSEDEYTWNIFSQKQKETDKKVDKIIEELITNKTNNNINILYNKILNKEERNNEGLKTLNKYLNLINNTNTIEEYINKIITIENDLGIDIITNIKVDKDFKNTNKNIIYLYPITMDFGASADFYVNPDYMTYKALIKQYGIKILKEYGYDKKKARTISKNITDMYIDISSNSKLASDLEDVSNYYNIITIEDLKKIYTNFDIEKYLKARNITEKSFSIVDINNYKNINKYLTNDNLSLLKEYTKLKILESYAQYLSDNYSNLIYELNNKLSGIKKDKDTEIDKANNIISNFFTYDIDKKYKEENYNPEEYTYINNMTKEIISYYEKDIDNLDWLSKETKEKAKLKLKNLKINIGMNTDYPNYSNEYNLKESYSLVECIIQIGKTLNKYELSKLKTNNQEPLLSETTVNAYYNPQDNSINFPLASLELFDIKDNYYKNLGSIGMIIAHEITHAFDSNGSKFDENGNMSNWWTKEDDENYEKKKKQVIKYYNKYEVLKGSNINGKKTVNENIADLGAVSCISNIAKEKRATDKEIKEMYTSFAKLWASKSTPEYETMLLLQDTHSPAKYRVNATLSSTDLFYKTYNINFLNEMYIDKDNRVKIW